MAEIVRLILFPTIIVAAWFVSKHRSELARKSARLLPAFVFGILVCIAVTGWVRPAEGASTIHKWAGHALVMVAWLSVPFAVGVALQQHIRQRPVVAMAQVVALLSLLGLALLAAVTGYLGPSSGNQLTEETRIRFNVLHMFAYPGIVAVLLVGWFWFFRSRRDSGG